MNTCETCKWWGKLFLNYLEEPDSSGKRYCEHPDLPDFAKAEYGDAEVVTTLDFGCILWEPKTEEENAGGTNGK